MELYSVTAMRFTLADSGDSMNDANFKDDTAETAVLRLTAQYDFFKVSDVPPNGNENNCIKFILLHDNRKPSNPCPSCQTWNRPPLRSLCSRAK